MGSSRLKTLVIHLLGVFIFNQIINVNYVTSLAPQIKNLNVQCDANGMRVDVTFDSPFNGIVFSKGYYNDMGCRYVQEKSDSSSLKFKIPADRCGTSIVRTDAKDSKQYENVIIFQNDPIYQEVWDSARLLSCRYLLERDLPVQEKRVVFKPFIVDMLDVITVPMADFAGDQHKVDCWMDVTKGRYPNNSPIDGPVKVGENLTLAIYIRDSRKRTDIRVKDCYAYDNEESVNDKSPALLQLSGEDGCPLKPKLMDVWKRTAQTGNTEATVLAYSTVTAFKFPEHSNVHLTCNVELCKNQCADRCSLESKGIEGLKEGEAAGEDGEGEGKSKSSESGSGADGDDEDEGKKDEGDVDVKPVSGPSSGEAAAPKDESKKNEDDEEDAKSDDDTNSETETSSAKSPTTASSTTAADTGEDEDSASEDKAEGSTSERGGRKSSSDDNEDEEKDEDDPVGSSSTTTTTTTTTTTSTTTAKPDEDEDAGSNDEEDEDTKPETSPMTTTSTSTTSTTTEKPSGKSEDDAEEDEDGGDDSETDSRKRSLKPSKAESKSIDSDDEAEDEDNEDNSSKLISSSDKSKQSSKSKSAATSEDEDYDDEFQSSRGSSTSVSPLTTTTTPIPKTPLIIVIKPEKNKKKIKEAARRGRIESRSRQAIRSSSSKLGSSRSSSSRDSCCSDITSTSSRPANTTTTSTTTTKSPTINRSSVRSVRRSSRFDESDSSNLSNKRSKKQTKTTTTTTTTTVSPKRTTTTTTNKKPRRRSTTTSTTARPKTTTEKDEDEETETPRKLRKSTRKPKRPVVRTRKSLIDRLFIPHSNDRLDKLSSIATSTTTTTSSPSVSSSSSTTLRIASNRFSTRRSNPYLRSTLKPATIPPSRNNLRVTSSSTSAPLKRLADFDEFKENEALAENEQADRSFVKPSSLSASGASRRWDGDELFNPFKEMNYEPVRLSIKRNRRSVYTFSSRSNYDALNIQ